MINLQDVFVRVAQMQKEALAPVDVDTYPFGYFEQGATPYFINRLGASSIDLYGGSDIFSSPTTIQMRLVIAHITEGYRGDNYERLRGYIEDVLQYFGTHPRLNSAVYPTTPNYLLGDATIVSHTGEILFQNSGIGVLQVGVEFSLQFTYVYGTI
jgi:hypothetical protein